MRIVRYRRRDWRAEAAAQPAAMRSWRGNSGAEAMVRLADGRFLVFAEGRDEGALIATSPLFAGDPARSGARAARRCATGGCPATGSPTRPCCPTAGC